MSDDLRDRLNAKSTDQRLEILKGRNAGEWREEVFPIGEGDLGVMPTEGGR